MGPGRGEILARAAALGMNKGDYVQDTEESVFWDATIKEVAVIRESGGFVSINSDYVPIADDHLAHLYHNEGESR